MENERSAKMPMALSAVLLLVAVLLGRSWLGALVALGAAAVSGYVCWLGVQSKAQTKLVAGMLLMLGAAALAILIVLGRAVSWFR
ncbi:MAG: hypothetical protein V2A73_18060 [Pseudomonadota bacterium]